jgi:hypothetical protein
MRHLLAALVLALPLYLPWTSRGDAFDRETLETALILAGLDGTNLPITLARVAPASASAVSRPGLKACSSSSKSGSCGRASRGPGPAAMMGVECPHF